MDIVDAYLDYCEEHNLDAPTDKMQTHLRVRLKPKKWVINSINLERVHRLRASIVKLHNSEDPKGVGERFDEFCQKRGRVRPTADQIQALNEDAFQGAQAIRSDSTNPLLYRALVTFRAYGGF